MTPTRWLVSVLSFALAFGVSAMIVARTVPTTGLPSLGASVHLVLLTIALVELCCRAGKIHLSGRALRVHIPFGTAMRTVLGGDFAAAITPARSGAEPARFLVLAEARVPLAERLIVLFLELFLELWSLLAVCLTLALAFRGTSSSMRGLLGLVGGYATFVLSVGAVGFALSRRAVGAPPPGWLARLGVQGARWERLSHFLHEWGHAVRGLRHAHVPTLAVSLLASVVHIVLRVATLPVLIALADPGFAWTRETLAPLVLWPLALFYGSVVVPAPSGGGAVEGAFTYVLRDAIPAALFASALLWWRFYTYYLYMLLGGLAAGRTVMRALRPAAPRPSAMSSAVSTT
ncbi:MAG: flippase-like domain-containing protein [Gemmatimonadaceae bacterium]|nr:flippase-like domain-containing protein [Gemmatimonadaceae bacterium]